jgi:endonuclease YncB( thermonuclease family)
VTGFLAPTWRGVPLDGGLPRGWAASLVADEYVRAVEGVVRLIDGDTFLCRVDLGFNTLAKQSCRLAGLNCNEIGEPGGPEARDELARLLAGGAVTVHSVHADKYAGRFDALVYVAGAGGRTLLDVNRSLVEHGYAVPWNGVGVKPRVPWPRVAPGAPTSS